MREEITIKSANSILMLSAKTGAVLSVAFQGCSITLGGNSLFSLGLRGTDGELDVLSSNSMQFESEGKDGVLKFHYSLPGKRQLYVNVSIHSEAGFFHFRPEIGNLPAGVFLEWIDVPQIVVPANGRIFWPHTEGVLIDHPEERQKSPWSRYHLLGFLSRTEGIAYSEGGYYPGVCQMQFLSWEKDGTVLYFGAHDRKHGTKAVEYEPFPDGRCRLSLQTFCGAENPYTPGFDYVFGALNGDWMDACSVYRNWIQDDPMLPERGKLPKMVRESPVVVIHPVRGHGDDKGQMIEGNEYFPYLNALPYIEKYSSDFDSRILSLLMHWEGTAPWAPPYVWPPFGGVETLKKYADSLHAGGNYLGVYCSGSAWTQKSCIVSYSREKECEEKGLRRYMIRGPKGEIEAVICCAPQAQREGFDLCLTEDWSRKTLLDEARKLTECEIDYAQFFDQNLGGGYHTCYSREHDHPPVPGAWQTQAMSSLLDEMAFKAVSAKREMIFGCEGATADVYLKYLPFNDLRSCWNWEYGIPVPGYQFVFHEYCNNFMGNQCGITNVMDSKVSPEHFLYRTAYAFISGDLLSIVLKEDGRVHWGWGAFWEMKGPDQNQAVTLIRNLNQFRKKWGKFLQYGRMEKPAVRVMTDEYCLRVNGRNIAIPSCLHSSWTASDGECAEIIVNYFPKKQSVHCIQPHGENIPFFDEIFELAPLTAVCICLNAKQTK